MAKKKYGEVQIETRLHFQAGSLKGSEDFADSWNDADEDLPSLKKFSKKSAEERLYEKYPEAHITKVSQSVLTAIPKNKLRKVS